MNKTELLALADALMNVAVSEGDWTATATAADILRKLAALEPVASSYTMEALVPHSGGPKTHISVNRSMPPGTNLFNLTGIIDHE